MSVITTLWNSQTILIDGQNFLEYVLECILDQIKTQIGEDYGCWVTFIGTMLSFICVSNWSRAHLKIIQLPHGGLATTTSDINTSMAYFYAGLTRKGLAYICIPGYKRIVRIKQRQGMNSRRIVREEKKERIKHIDFGVDFVIRKQYKESVVFLVFGLCPFLFPMLNLTVQTMSG